MEVTSIVVVGAYGRDYKNKSSAVQDWRSGLDFFLLKENGRPMGTYCSNRDFPAECSVTIRYKKKTLLVIINN